MDSQDISSVWSPYAKRYRLYQTCCMPLVSTCLGMAISIVSPTITDMIRYFNCNYEQYSKALMMKSVGTLFGCYLGGIAVDRYKKYFNIFIFSNAIIFGLASIGMPWYPSLNLLGFLYIILGIAHSGLLTGMKSYLVAVWADKAPMPVYSVYMTFTFGQVLGPLISQPFITHNLNITSNITTENTPISKYSETVFAPYVICGAISCLLSCLFLVFACISLPHEIVPTNQNAKSFKEIFSLGTCGNGNALFGTFWVLLLFVFYMAHVARLTTVNIFIHPIAVECRLHFSPSVATTLQTVYYICGTVGRLLFGLLSFCVSIKISVYVLLLLALVAYSVLAFEGLSSQYMFWIFVCSSKFFAAPVAPTVIAWADRYSPVTGLVVAVTDTGSSVGEFVSTWISGMIYQINGAQDLLYFIYGCAVLLIVVVLLMQIIGSAKGDRYSRKRIEIEEQINYDESISNSTGENTPLTKT